MEKGHARINATMEQLRQLSPEALDAKLYAHMPDAVFRLFTFEEDDYEKDNVTILCFNFIPPCFFVTCQLNQVLEKILAEIAELNPGLEWEKVEDRGVVDDGNSRRTQTLQIKRVPAREGIDSNGEKIRLTQLDIQAIYKTLRHPAFRMGAMGMFSHGNPLNPCFISPGGLVFIYGNPHFGVTHINERHGWFSDGSEWRTEQSGRQFLDNPSKFSKKSLPVDDYRRIADEIYCPQNRTTSKEETVFEKYTGAVEYAGEAQMTFHLILYKGTKIVHTLYPQSKKLNRIRRNRVDFKRGQFKVSFKPIRNIVIAELPYYNSDLVIRYVIVVKLDNNTGCRQIWIETTTLKGNPMFCEMVQETFGNEPMDGERFFMGLEYADFSGLEKWIKDFDCLLESKMNSADPVASHLEE
jgi:hypothetical protein